MEEECIKVIIANLQGRNLRQSCSYCQLIRSVKNFFKVLLHVRFTSSRRNYFDRHLFRNLLAAEDCNWWWRSFMTSGSTAFYFFIYAAHYYSSKLTLDKFASVILYFGYTSIMTLFVFLYTGSIGFFACYWFVQKIYGAVKVE